MIGTYECTLMHRPYRDAKMEPCLRPGGGEWTTEIYAASAGAARYEWYRELRDLCYTVQDGDDYVDVSFRHIRVRKVGRSATMAAEVMCVGSERGVPFARLGMSVKVGEWSGRIAGVNDSANFDVLFEDGPHKGQKLNCHPNWEMTYFDQDGAVIRAFTGEVGRAS